MAKNNQVRISEEINTENLIIIVLDKDPGI